MMDQMIEALNSLKNISKLNDVSVIRQKNSGLAHLENIGISNASGEWIGYFAIQF